MKLFINTKEHSNYWRTRKIDWKTSYLDTWSHPHRNMISQILSRFNWISLIEVGMGGGANLINISKHLKGKQLGGIDVNQDAVDLVMKTFNGGHFKIGSVDDIMMSDDSADVVLSDMTLIYVSNINKAISEIKRIARRYVVLCELHSASLYDRIKLKWTSGYHAYDYKKLLEKHGFEDIQLIKIPPEVWDGKPQKPFGYIIIAKVPTRK